MFIIIMVGLFYLFTYLSLKKYSQDRYMWFILLLYMFIAIMVSFFFSFIGISIVLFWIQFIKVTDLTQHLPGAVDVPRVTILERHTQIQIRRASPLLIPTYGISTLFHHYSYSCWDFLTLVQERYNEM